VQKILKKVVVAMQIQKVLTAKAQANVFPNRSVAQLVGANKNRAKAIYDSLLTPSAIAESERVQRYRSYSYLLTQLEAAEKIDTHIPENPKDLAAWLTENVNIVGEQYRSYIVDRKGSLPRRFFSNKSQALHFLHAVAPTKLVDGAWLFGLVQQWRSPHLAPLIDIYLDELGHGAADKNHVLLYKKLLADEGIDADIELSEGHYVQGAIQLALAHHGDSFLPEILGFNLGYEQLPLHLLITAYELRELGIDPHYFNLHVTIDNLHSGHAQKSLQGLLELLPRIDDSGAFYRRVIRGYKLNFLGETLWSIIGSFNLENELISMLSRKSEIGKLMHSDHKKIGDRSVNEWLSEPRKINNFLAQLIKAGWIHPNEDPEKSRFWHLIADKKAVMSGVFTRAEQQLVYDWIAGNSKISSRHGVAASKLTSAEGRGVKGAEKATAEKTAAGILLKQQAGETALAQESISPDLNGDAQHLQQRLSQLHGREAALDYLVRYLSPSLHHTPVGLAATRMFSNALRRRPCN